MSLRTTDILFGSIKDWLKFHKCLTGSMLFKNTLSPYRSIHIQQLGRLRYLASSQNLWSIVSSRCQCQWASNGTGNLCAWHRITSFGGKRQRQQCESQMRFTWLMYLRLCHSLACQAWESLSSACVPLIYSSYLTHLSPPFYDQLHYSLHYPPPPKICMQLLSHYLEPAFLQSLFVHSLVHSIYLSIFFPPGCQPRTLMNQTACDSLAFDWIWCG